MKFPIPNSSFLLLCLVCLFAALMRFADLQNCPAGLFRDEAEKGYNAWALATSGGALDFSGGAGDAPAIQWRRLPWMINVMGGKTSAIYQYASIPFIWLGGLSVATTRMASALAGTLTVALAGLLFMRAWGVWPGLAVAVWLALSPWHLVFSRWALEGIFVPFFISATLAGLWGLERERRWGPPLAGASLGWLFYAYSGAQPFVLSWGLCLLVLYRRRLSPRHWPFWAGVALFLIPVIPTLVVRLTPGGSIRLARIALWSEPGITAPRLFGRFIVNYLAHFDPRFLFWRGDSLPRHAIPGMGQLTILDALLLPVGLLLTFRRQKPLAGALLAAFLCGPLPAAITRVGIPHGLRSLAMVVPAACWGGMGLAALAGWIRAAASSRMASPVRARALAGTFVAASLLAGLNGFVHYWRQYHASPLVQVAFEAGKRQAWETLAREKKPGQRVFINGHIPYAPYYQLFFMQPPARRVPVQTLEKGGYHYFDPRQDPPAAVEGRMAPGDWLIEPVDPVTIRTAPSAPPWISREDAAKAGEPWVWLTQK